MRFSPSGLSSLLHGYLNESTLHGLRYVGDSAISVAERALFAASFVLLCTGTAFFVAQVYDKWTAVPVIVTMNGRITAITDIPFPAVTVCNMNQARRDVAARFADGSNDALLLRSLCARNPGPLVGNRANDSSWPRFRSLLRRVAQPCAEMLLMCQYGTKLLPCTSAFRTELTDEGMCCTFNAVHRRFMLQR